MNRFTTSDDPERIVIPKIVRLLKQIDTTDNKHAFFHLMFHFARLPLYYPEKIQLDGAPDIVARDTTKALDCKEKTQSKRETKGRKNTKNDCCVSLEYAEIETILKVMFHSHTYFQNNVCRSNLHCNFILYRSCKETNMESNYLQEILEY